MSQVVKVWLRKPQQTWLCLINNCRLSRSFSLFWAWGELSTTQEGKFWRNKYSLHLLKLASENNICNLQAYIILIWLYFYIFLHYLHYFLFIYFIYYIIYIIYIIFTLLYFWKYFWKRRGLWSSQSSCTDPPAKKITHKKMQFLPLIGCTSVWWPLSRGGWKSPFFLNESSELHFM